LSETKPVFIAKTQEENAPLIIATDHFYVTGWNGKPYSLQITVANKTNDERIDYELDLQGIYQLKNIPAVLESVKQLQKQGWNIKEQHTQKGLRHTKKITGFHGRWDIVHRGPMLVLDVGHNEDGIKQIAEQIEITDHDNLHIVIGLVTGNLLFYKSTNTKGVA